MWSVYVGFVGFPQAVCQSSQTKLIIDQKVPKTVRDWPIMDPHHYQFMTSFITIFAGYLAKRAGVVLLDDIPALSRLLFGLLIPSLILSKMTIMPMTMEYVSLMGLGAVVSLWSIVALPILTAGS